MNQRGLVAQRDIGMRVVCAEARLVETRVDACIWCLSHLLVSQNATLLPCAGLSTQFEPPGSPASAHGVSIMREHGVDMVDHRSTLLSPTDVLEATHIYCVTSHHRDAVVDLQIESNCLLQRDQQQKGIGKSTSSPASGDVVDTTRQQALVSTFEPEIPDPWHGTTERFRACAVMLEDAVSKALLEEHAENKSTT